MMRSYLSLWADDAEAPIDYHHRMLNSIYKYIITVIKAERFIDAVDMFQLTITC